MTHHGIKRHRIGIVGCGGIAHSHLRGYRSVLSQAGEVVAGCDRDRARLQDFCDTYGIGLRFTSAQEMIESGEVDVISLLTPPSVRAEVIFPAVERGIHLLVEKPFAENTGDACDFVAAAERASTTHAVNHRLRFMPDALAAREMIASGDIGDIRFVAHDHFQSRTRTTGWRREEDRLEISIFSIHVLDRIRWLCDLKPERVAAVTRHWDVDVRGETFTALTIQFSGGALGTMVSNWHSLGIPECRFRIDGTTGSILSTKQAIAGDEATLAVHQLGREMEQRRLTQQDAAAMNMGGSMACLLAAVDAHEAPHHSGRDNLWTMAIVDAAYLSASRGGAGVDISEVSRRPPLE